MNKETDNKLEVLFDKLLNDGDVTELKKNWDDLNRLEQYLVCLISKSDIDLMGEPKNRLEVLLTVLYNKNKKV
jgi:hypothetical protein